MDGLGRKACWLHRSGETSVRCGRLQIKASPVWDLRIADRGLLFFLRRAQRSRLPSRAGLSPNGGKGARIFF